MDICKIVTTEHKAYSSRPMSDWQQCKQKMFITNCRDLVLILVVAAGRAYINRLTKVATA